MRHWIGGLVATMPAAVSILAPTVNSYRRMIGFAAAPTTPTWCEENKTTALRVISRSAKLARVEHRVASADVNVYLAFAVILAGGIAGIDGAIEPPPEHHDVGVGRATGFGAAAVVDQQRRRRARARQAAGRGARRRRSSTTGCTAAGGNG